MHIRNLASKLVAFRILGSLTVLAACGRESPSPTDSRGTSLPAIVVTPSAVSLGTSQSYQFSAFGRTASFDSVTVAVSWSATGGSISSDGAFTASTVAGDYLVIATGPLGRADSASIHVTATGTPPPPPAVPQAECAAARSEWIWCDDFEQDRLSRYFEYGDAGGRFTRTTGVGYAGSTGMRARWTQGAMDAGFLHLAMGKTPNADLRPVDAGTAVYREVFWRVYVKNQAGWVGGGADKLTRALSFATSNFSEAAFAHVWSGVGAGSNNYLMLDPASGTDVNGNLVTTTYNDFAHMRWLGSVLGRIPVFDNAHVGQWHCIEAHVRLNTAGQSNGVLELWVDGSLDAQRTGLNFVGTAPYGMNAVYFENYWNSGTGAPVAEERYLDNIVVSTAKIGCL